VIRRKLEATIKKVKKMRPDWAPQHSKFTRMVAFLVLSISVVPTANAYLDPGSGSIIIQGIVGVLVAIGMTVKLYWYKIKSLIRRKKLPDIEPGNEDKLEQ
jgi:hypothetical protein